MTTDATRSGNDGVRTGAARRDEARAARQAFIAHLYALNWALTSERHHAPNARRELAVLRRSFAGSRQQAEALDVVLPHNPPDREEKVWLLVAGLFALHPHPRSSRPFGAAMGLVEQKRGDAAKRRFLQLLAVDLDAIPHYLRQAVQLLRADGVRLDYGKLLEDLVKLLAENLNDQVRREEVAHRIRLGWARDFHRRQGAESPDTTTTEETTASEPAAT